MDLVRRCVERIAVLASKVALKTDGCAILMFHRVAEHNPAGLRINEHLKVTPDFLQTLISQFKSRGYSFLSMDEVVENLQKSRRMPKTVALTFDDGYLDNFTVAQPILCSEKVPGIVYVATGFNSGETSVRWDALEDFILSVEELTMPDGAQIECRSLNDKEKIFLILRKWILSLSTDEMKNEILRLCDREDIWLDSFASQMADFDIVGKFASDKWLSIGCHTHRHMPCGTMSAQEMRVDLDSSLECLRSCKVKVRHFAFPYGDDVDDDNLFAEMFVTCGIESAVTTYSGIVRVGKSSRFYLPRIFVSEFDGFGIDDVCLANCQMYLRTVKNMLFRKGSRKKVS